MEEAKSGKKSVQRQPQEKSPASQAKKATKPKKDLTGNHPPPKKPCSPWIYWNTEISAKFRAEGK